MESTQMNLASFAIQTWHFDPVLACDSSELDYPHNATIAHAPGGP